MKSSHLATLVLLFVMGLLVSACSTSSQAPTSTLVPTALEERAPEASATVAVQPTVESGEAPSEPTSGPPPVKTALQATDPRYIDLAAGKPTFVEFFAYWWPICQALAPVVHGLEAEYYDQVNFVYLDIDDSQTIPFRRELGYVYQPHLFLLDGEGNILQQWLGSPSETDLRTGIESALN